VRGERKGGVGEEFEVRSSFLPLSPSCYEIETYEHILELPSRVSFYSSASHLMASSLPKSQPQPSGRSTNLVAPSVRPSTPFFRADPRSSSPLLSQMPTLLLPPHHINAQVLHLSAVTLTFLLHFYVHSHVPPTSSLSIPASLSKPLFQVSNLLGLPPILTYATTVLWNVIPTNPSLTFDVHSNRPTEVHHTFTGLESERQFYLVSSLIEIHGVKALGIMRAALDEAFVGDALALRRITGYLRSLSGAIDELTEVMAGMKSSGCDPAEFYWLIRPWFKGSDAEGPGGLGWLFEGVGEGGEGERRSVSGPSAGQSSIVHALDIFLGIDHSPAKKEGSAAADATFMERMLQYMPGPHRRFLLHLQTGPTIRELVLAHPDFAGGDLTRAFDETVTTMGRFRDGHSKFCSLCDSLRTSLYLLVASPSLTSPFSLPLSFCQ